MSVEPVARKKRIKKTAATSLSHEAAVPRDGEERALTSDSAHALAILTQCVQESARPMLDFLWRGLVSASRMSYTERLLALSHDDLVVVGTLVSRGILLPAYLPHHFHDPSFKDPDLEHIRRVNLDRYLEALLTALEARPQKYATLGPDHNIAYLTKKLGLSWPRDKIAPENIRFLETRGFRQRFAEILAWARSDNDNRVIVHTGPDPRVVIKREDSAEPDFTRIDQQAVDEKPQKYIMEAAFKGRCFVLEDGQRDEQPIVMRRAGPEWYEETRAHEPPAAAMKRSRQRARQSVLDERGRNFAAALSEALGQPVPVREAFGRLSPREKEVALLLLDGNSKKQIAAQLELTTGAVRYYRRQLFSKLGLSTQDSVAELRRAAMEN